MKMCVGCVSWRKNLSGKRESQVEKYNKHKNKRINEKQIDDGWTIVNSTYNSVGKKKSQVEKYNKFKNKRINEKVVKVKLI